MKIQEIIDALKQYHPAIDESFTCDVIKYGDPGIECTGIAVSCFGSAEVIRRAHELGANFLIVHEPLFWTNADTCEGFEENRVYIAKKDMLDEYGITVWRDHDHIHGGPPTDNPHWPDNIFIGIAAELGWENYILDSKNKPLLYSIPETDAEELGHFLIDKLHLNGIRIVGDRHTKVKKVYFAEHIFPDDGIGISKIQKTELEDVDALIPFETVDWTVNEFIRDSCNTGRPRIMYNIGHFNVEELGMKYMLSYLPELAGGTPVYHIFSGDSFDFIV